MTFSEFIRRHNSRELSEILARDLVDPFDIGMRIELAAAKICSLIYGTNRSGNMDRLTAADFMPEWGRTHRETVAAESVDVAAVRRKLLSAFGVSQ